MRQDKFLELLEAQFGRNLPPALAFRHLHPPENGTVERFTARDQNVAISECRGWVRRFSKSATSGPRWADRPGEPVPAAFELWSVVVRPAHDCRVNQRQAALRHHLHEVAVAKFEPQDTARTRR
jgi:hypothetical protein